MENKMDALKDALEIWNISITEKQLFQFEKYFELLIEWNSFMNLTAITSLQDVIDKHFIDSLAIVRYTIIDQKKILDLGTGAGFPGIPLKILFPDTELVLLDSLNKRVKFLNTVIETLQLEKITAVHGRAEEFAQNKLYREQFDFCVSRAVANLSTLSEYCIPFVNMKGSFVSYKAEHAENEIEEAKNAVHILGGKIEQIETYRLPNTDIGRTLIFIKKIESTKKRYPRKAGIPGKEPLY